eukprot:Nk52_evm4s267 gene=Nk52_evmTU4s267
MVVQALLKRLAIPPLAPSSLSSLYSYRSLRTQSSSSTASTPPAAHNHNNNNNNGKKGGDDRIELLHASLRKLELDPEPLHQANVDNMTDPVTHGYDPRFGKPAIRTYRSFIYPKDKSKSKSEGMDNVRLRVLADQCARQIDFLQRQHRVRKTDWIRHTDVHRLNKDGEGEDGEKKTAQRSQSRFPLILVLDNLRSVFNVGSIFRTADACGCAEVITTGITAHPNGGGAEKLAKSALGAENLIPTRHFSTTKEALQQLRREFSEEEEEVVQPKHIQHVVQPPPRRWRFLGMETTRNSVRYTHLDYPKHEGIVLVLGNEVTGLDPDLMVDFLDCIVQIPMFGFKNSLNVAACAPVVLYEILRQWEKGE